MNIEKLTELILERCRLRQKDVKVKESVYLGERTSTFVNPNTSYGQRKTSLIEVILENGVEEKILVVSKSNSNMAQSRYERRWLQIIGNSKAGNVVPEIIGFDEITNPPEIFTLYAGVSIDENNDENNPFSSLDKSTLQSRLELYSRGIDPATMKHISSTDVNI